MPLHSPTTDDQMKDTVSSNTFLFLWVLTLLETLEII